MLRDGLPSKRRQLHAELNYHWSELTQEDLHGFDGDREQLIDLLETRYGFAKRRAESEAQWFFDHFEEKLRRAS